MKVVKAPNQYSRDTFSIFLAGSIEMGVAEDWQTQVTEQFAMYENVTILNPILGTSISWYEIVSLLSNTWTISRNNVSLILAITFSISSGVSDE